MNKNTTALICSFARYYHTKNSNIKIYNDVYAEQLLSKEEINNISKNLIEGINYFNPNYNGNDPLSWIVNNNLVPSLLARSKFNEIHLLNEINLGLKQYVILASGYDTSSFKVNNKVRVYELDKSAMINDKKTRIKNAGINTTNITYIKTDFNNNWIDDLLNTSFNSKEKTFTSMLGISYYLDKETFENTIKSLSLNTPKGSIILFDYPNENETEKEIINKELAAKADEHMKSIYTYSELEKIAENNNMLIYEHLNNEDIDKMFFYNYNTLNPDNKIIAPKGISYCAMIKQ